MKDLEKINYSLYTVNFLKSFLNDKYFYHFIISQCNVKKNTILKGDTKIYQIDEAIIDKIINEQVLLNVLKKILFNIDDYSIFHNFMYIDNNRIIEEIYNMNNKLTVKKISFNNIL